MTEATPDAATCQEAFDTFRVTCQCGSQRVEWFNSMGWSEMSGGWGEAGFRCLDCRTEVEMITA